MEDSVKVYGQQNFNLPHDVLELPSGGKFYKSKKKSVKVGYLTASDENLIMSSPPDELIMNLVRTKLYEPDLRPDEMLNGDIEAVLIFLRNTAFGPEYNVSVVDPKTNQRFSTSILLDELDFKKDVQTPEEDGTYVTTLPRSEASVTLRPLTYKELQDINKQASSYPQGRIAPKVTWKLQKQIVSVNGDSSQSVINSFIDGLPIVDSKYIRNFLDDNEPRLDLRKTVITPSGEKVSVDITFGVEFFRVFF